MIDNFSIFISTATIVFVIWRAALLSRKLPWFPRASQAAPPAAIEEPDRWTHAGGRETPPPWRR